MGDVEVLNENRNFKKIYFNYRKRQLVISGILEFNIHKSSLFLLYAMSLRTRANMPIHNFLSLVTLNILKIKLARKNIE